MMLHDMRTDSFTDSIVFQTKCRVCSFKDLIVFDSEQHDSFSEACRVIHLAMISLLLYESRIKRADGNKKLHFIFTHTKLYFHFPECQ